MRTRRTPRRLFLAWIALATVLVAAWRFASDSLSMDPLIPYVERAAEDGLAGLEVDLGSLRTAWGGWRHGMNFVASDVSLRAGDVAVRVPEVILTLSLRALVHGHLAPTRLEVRGVEGKVIRDRNGRIRLFALDSGRVQPVGAPALQRLLEDLGTAPDPSRPLTYMRSFLLRDASFVVEDQVLGVVSSARQIDVNLDSADTPELAVAGEYRASVQLTDHEAVIDGTLRFDSESKLLRLQSRFAGIPADAIGSRIPAARAAARIRADVDGSVDLGISLTGSVHDVAFSFACQPGLLSVPGWLDEPEPFRRLSARARFDRIRGSWQVDEAALGLGTDESPGPTLSMSAATGDAAQLARREVVAALAIDGLEVADLGRLWPEEMLPTTRKWVVERVLRGELPKVAAEAKLKLPDESTNEIELTQLRGRFTYRDLTIRWNDEAPAITAIDGDVDFEKNALRFAVEEARIGSVAVGPGRVDLLELDRNPGRIEIDVRGSGPLADVLRSVNLRLPPFLPASGNDSETASAPTSFAANIGFRMRNQLRFPDFEIEVAAEVTDVPVSSDLAFGLASGKVSFASGVSEPTLSGDLDISGIRSSVDLLGWSKASGERGRARFALAFGDAHVRALRSLHISTDTLEVRGSVEFDERSGHLRTVRLDELAAGRTRLASAAARWADDTLEVDLADGEVDLAPLFRMPKALHASTQDRTLVLSARGLTRLWLSDDGFVTDVSGSLRRSALGFESLSLRGLVPSAGGGRNVAVEVTPKTPATVAARVTTGDLGGLVRALGWSRSLVGGVADISAADLSRSFDAGHVTVRVTDFAIREAPTAVRLLSLASLESLLDTLQGENLRFASLDGRVELAGSLLRIAEMRAHGSSLGWVARGAIDLEAGSADLTGTLIPAYTANRVLKSVPVLREVLVGEGILAVDFEIAGPLTSPVIDAHPMSAITPELLRGVFGVR